uniref:Uncharacterized protein MANES_01G197400 n=1 Tax=Rhizophora mucronata TaxID=61149 RepID=A0A2P2QMU9_RHIMU
MGKKTSSADGILILTMLMFQSIGPLFL